MMEDVTPCSAVNVLLASWSKLYAALPAKLSRRPSTRVRYRSPCRLWYPRTSCTSTLNGLTIPRQSCPPVLPWLPGTDTLRVTARREEEEEEEEEEEFGRTTPRARRCR
jgi:hypothetical protein